MPVALAGPRTRRENQEIDAELRQTRGVAEFSALARAARQIKWRWIKRSDDPRNLLCIDTFLHRSHLGLFWRSSQTRLLARARGASLQVRHLRVSFNICIVIVK